MFRAPFSRIAWQLVGLLAITGLVAPSIAGPVADPAAFAQCTRICSELALACHYQAAVMCHEWSAGSATSDPACFSEGVGECVALLHDCRTGCLSIKYPPAPEARRSPAASGSKGAVAEP